MGDRGKSDFPRKSEILGNFQTFETRGLSKCPKMAVTETGHLHEYADRCQNGPFEMGHFKGKNRCILASVCIFMQVTCLCHSHFGAFRQPSCILKVWQFSKISLFPGKNLISTKIRSQKWLISVMIRGLWVMIHDSWKPKNAKWVYYLFWRVPWIYYLHIVTFSFSIFYGLESLFWKKFQFF